MQQRCCCRDPKGQVLQWVLGWDKPWIPSSYSSLGTSQHECSADGTSHPRDSAGPPALSWLFFDRE